VPPLTLHLLADRIVFGKEYENVHRWMDDWGWQHLGFLHRIYRHDARAIEEIRRMWGDDAAKAGELHLWLDWNPGVMLFSMPFYQDEVVSWLREQISPRR